MNAIILARVSTEEQMAEGHSIPAQLEKMREYCRIKELKIWKEHSFDESSIKDHREKFLKVIEEVKRSKQTTALVVETIDRLQRSFKESVMLEELRKQSKVEIHFIRENLIITANSNSSEIQRWDLGVFLAKSYVLQISDNVKRSIQQKLRQGECPGKAPVGYLNISNEATGKKDIVIDDRRAHIVRSIFEEYATGNYSVNTILKYAQDMNLTVIGRKDISRAYMHLLLQNPFYIGQMKTKYGEYPHRYGALISEYTFERCQEILKGKNRNRRKFMAKPSIFRGLVKCPVCGWNMGVDFKKGRYTYLFCHNAKRHISKCSNTGMTEEKMLLTQVEQVFKNIQMPEGLFIKTKEHLKTITKAEQDFNKDSVDELRQEYDAYQKRIKVLIDMKIDQDAGIKGMSISNDDHAQKMTEYKRKQREIELKISEHTTADEKFNITLLTVLDLARNAYGLFKSSSIEEKRKLLSFVTTNMNLEGKKLNFVYRKPFDEIAKGLNNLEWLPGLDSNQQPFD
ncbi:recombinase family protein [Elusimicrobium posterum]|uniref:recombinase family protein n=1 Tax=Elusimicrobium posterum TaxID=3116653 RepID=UPI003C717529